MEKIATIQDSYFVLGDTQHNNHEDTLKLNAEFFNYLEITEKCDFTVQLDKENFIQNACCIIRDFRLIKKKHPFREMSYDLFFYKDLLAPIEKFFGNSQKKDYNLTVRDAEERFLFSCKLQNDFSVRKYIVEKHTKIIFEKYENSVVLKLEYIPFDEQQKDVEFEVLSDKPLQQIYYGAPGTGKSHTINRDTKGRMTFRTTFHPDSDYSTFVGAYKPVMEEVETRVVPVVLSNGAAFDQNCGTLKERKISYKFVKQTFMKAYIAAWRAFINNSNVTTTTQTPSPLSLTYDNQTWTLEEVTNDKVLYTKEEIISVEEYKKEV